MVNPGFDYAYSVAAEYFPGLPREDFDAWTDDYSLARLEWDEIVGPEPTQARVGRFYCEGYGLLFHLVRDLAPVGAWGALEDRANIIRQHMDKAGLKSVLDFGGGIGGTALQLARRGYTVGLVEVGPVLEFARWYSAHEGRISYTPRAACVTYYRALAAATRGRGWQFIAALDVLEHCWDPVDILMAFRDKLPDGGLLMLTRHSFKEHPTHLERTFWLFEALDRVLDDMGFERQGQPDPHYGIGAWRKRLV